MRRLADFGCNSEAAWILGLGGGFFGVEVGQDGGGLGAVYHRFQTGGVRLAYGLDAAEMAQQALHGLLSDTGNFQKFVRTVADLAAFAVKGYGKAVSLVANELHDVEDGRVVVNANRLILTAVDVDDFFPFRDRGQGLVDDADGFEGFSGGMELADTAVDEDEAGQRLLFFHKTLVATGYDLAHAGEIVHALYGTDNEFTVIGLLHLAVFPDDHGGDSLRSLDVGDVETLDTIGELGELEGVLQYGLHHVGLGTHDAKTLVIGLLGILSDEVDQRTLVAANGDVDLDAAVHLFAEDFAEGFSVFELHGHKDIPRDVLVIEIDLLQQGAEKFARLQPLASF